MTPEIRLRSAHPQRTPSSGNTNMNNILSGNSSAERSSSVTRRGERNRGGAEQYRTNWNYASQNYHDGGAAQAVDGQASSDASSYVSPRRHDAPSTGSGAYAPLHIQYQQDSVPGLGSPVASVNTTPPYDNMGKIRTGKLLRAEKTRLEDYHVAYRTPLHVADNAYRAYLQGRVGPSRRQAPMITRVCCLHTCIGFSVVAIIFLCFVGFLVTSQPMLMAGTLTEKLVQDSDGRISTRYILPAEGEVPVMARTAYHAAMAYFVCILACLVALNPGWIPSQIHRRCDKYEKIEDHPLPTHNPPDTPAVWNRCSYIIRQWLTDRGWYHPGPKIRKGGKTGSKYK